MGVVKSEHAKIDQGEVSGFIRATAAAGHLNRVGIRRILWAVHRHVHGWSSSCDCEAKCAPKTYSATRQQTVLKNVWTKYWGLVCIPYLWQLGLGHRIVCGCGGAIAIA